MLRQAQDKLAQHDKAVEASAVATLYNDNKKAAWPFEKIVFSIVLRANHFYRQAVQKPTAKNNTRIQTHALFLTFSNTHI
jgi:hypothetical protein